MAHGLQHCARALPSLPVQAAPIPVIVFMFVPGSFLAHGQLHSTACSRLLNTADADLHFSAPSQQNELLTLI